MKTNIKYLAFFIMLLALSYGANAATYTWNGTTSTSWAVATNWTPTRTTPATTDDIVITPTSDITITSFPTQTINSLTINGAGNYTVNMPNGNNSLTIATLFDIETGNTLDIGALRLNNAAALFTTSGAGTLKISNTTYLPLSKTWSFGIYVYGSTLQTIQVGTYNNLTINSSIAVGAVAANIAGGDVTINGTLTLINGILACGTSTGRNLNIASSASIVGGSSASYIYTANGTLSRKSVGTATLLYPLGTLTSYAPLTITNNTGTPNITTKLKSTFTNAPVDATKAVNLEWSVLSTETSTADISFQINSSNFGSAYNVNSGSELGNYTTSYATSSLNSPTGSDPYVFATTGLSIPTIGTNNYLIGNSSSITTSIADKKIDANQFNVINTTSDFLVNYSLDKPSMINLRLLNIDGRTIQTLSLGKQQQGQATISTVNLEKGLYVIVMQINGDKVTKKVVKF